MANLPENTNYFSAVDPKGNSLGFSDLKDTSGKSYFAYRNPGDTATTTDLTRVATTFDPRVPQPVTMEMLHNDRIPESVSSPIKKSLGGQYSDELDHAIALELSGSNNKTQLHLIPGRDTSSNYSPDPSYGPAAKFDLEVNNLAQKVISGDMSLFDAQVKISQDKKAWGDPIAIPWTPTSPSVPAPAGQPVATTQQTSGVAPGTPSNPFAGISSQTPPSEVPKTISPDIHNVVNQSYPQIHQAVADHIKNAVSGVYNPNATNNPSDLAFTTTHQTSGTYNPNENVSTSSNDSFFKQDYIIPPWAGGQNTTSNTLTLDKPTFEKRAAILAVPFTLLANKEITQDQAASLVTKWKSLPPDGLPTPNASGLIPLDAAQKAVQEWANPTPPPATFADKVRDFGKGWLPDLVREPLKGVASGLTANILPNPVDPNESFVAKTANVVGNVAGNIAGMLAGGWAIKGAATALRFVRGAELAADAAKAAGVTIDVGRLSGDAVATANQARNFEEMAKSAGLLNTWKGAIGKVVPNIIKKPLISFGKAIPTTGTAGLVGWGQFGVTGRELTGQQETSLKSHLVSLIQDGIYGGLMGSSAKSWEGVTSLGASTMALSFMFGNNAQDAFMNGAMMAGLHRIGYKKGEITGDPNINQSNEAFKRASAILNIHLGEDMPAVKKGQTVPEVWKPPIDKIEQMRLKYREEFPNDSRISDSPITDRTDAVDFLTKAALVRSSETIDKLGRDIPIASIESEGKKIIAAGKQLYRQTMLPRFRGDEDMSNIHSMGEMLRPGVSSTQYGSSITDLTKNLSLNFPDIIYPNPEAKIFPIGSFRVTGHSGEIDPVSQSNIDKLDSMMNTSKVSNRIFIVSDPSLDPVMRKIKYEQMVKTGKSKIIKPEDALRVYYIDANGRILKETGFVPQKERVNTGGNSQNTLYDQVMNRIKGYFKKAKTAEELRTLLNKDQSKAQVTSEKAKELFDQKDTIDNIPDQMILDKIHATNAPTWFDPNFNNSTIVAGMREHGLKVLTANVEKITPTKATEKQKGPMFSLNVPEQNWLESIALKDGKLQSTSNPVSSTISEIQKSQSSKTIIRKIQEVKPDISTPSNNLTKEEIKSLKKQGFSDQMIQRLNTPKVPPEITEPRMSETVPQTKASFNMSDFGATSQPENQTAKLPLPETQDVPAGPLAKKVVDTLGKFKEPTKPEPIAPTLKLVGTPEQKITQLTKEEGKVVQAALSEGRDFTPEEVRKIKEIDSQKSKVNETVDEPVGLIESLINTGKLTSKEASSYVEMEKEISNLTEKAKNEMLDNSELNKIGYFGKVIRDFLVSKGLKKLVKSTGGGTPEIPQYDSGADRFSIFEGDTSQNSKSDEEMHSEDQTQKALNLVSQIKKLGSGEERSGLESELQSLIRRNEVRNIPGISESVSKALKDKPIYKSSDKIFADEYGLKIGDNGYIVLKRGEPIFDDTFKTENKIPDNVSPTKFWSDKGLKTKNFSDDFKIFQKGKTQHSSQYVEGLKNMAAQPGVYSLWPKTLLEIIKKGVIEPQEKGSFIEKSLGGDPSRSYTFNSMMRPTKNKNYLSSMFEEKNSQGHFISQPFTRIKAQIGGATKESLAKIDEKTKQTEKRSETDRLNRISSGQGTNEDFMQKLGVDQNFLDRRGMTVEDLKGMSVKDVSQMEKIQDLTPFEIKFPSLLHDLHTGNTPSPKAIVNDAINAGRQWISDYNAKIKPGAKTMKVYIDNEGTWVGKKKVSGGWNELKKVILDNYEKDFSNENKSIASNPN